MDLGARIRARARELGLSDSEVARRLGVDASRMGRYIRNVNEPDLPTLVKLCVILELTPNDLLLPKRKSTDNRQRILGLIAASCDALSDTDLEVLQKTASALRDARKPV